MRNARENYRWWTVGAGGADPDTGHSFKLLWWLKLGPVAFIAYRWFDPRLRVDLHVLNGPNIRIWGPPL